jgi:hypothetical protein
MDGVRSREEIEPLTNYFVGRAQKDVGRRAGFGAIATSVSRDFSSAALRDSLPESEHVLGGDGYFFFDKKREWVTTASLSRSWVSGNASSIERLQRSPQRYFQRPDATHVHLDPTATSLKGWAGSVNLNRNSGKYWTFNTALWGTSPGFDSNSAGLMFAGDVWGGHVVLNLRKQDPDRWTRSRSLLVAKSFTRNFANQTTNNGFFLFGNATFLNYWNVATSLGLFPRSFSDRLTRGGPASINPGSGFFNMDFGTDARKALSVALSMSHSWDEFGGWDGSGQLTATIKPTASLLFSIGPSFQRSYGVAQYVRSITDPIAEKTFGSRYIFSDLDQSQVSMVSRINWTLSPRMSLQVYAQPFIAVGDYWSLKEFATPGTFDFVRYGSPGTRLDYAASDGLYTIDPDATGPAPAFTIDDPNFNFKSLRVNAIFRWEWRLGSTLYLVWTENSVDFSNPGRLSLGRDARRLWSAPSDDIFLAKFAYWFGK